MLGHCCSLGCSLGVPVNNGGSLMLMDLFWIEIRTYIHILILDSERLRWYL